MLRGIRAARVQYPEIGIGLLLCFMVGGDADHEVTPDAARQYLGQGVVGVDMAGAEGMVPMEHYRPLFARAKAEGIPFTIHAGECGSREYPHRPFPSGQGASATAPRPSVRRSAWNGCGRAAGAGDAGFTRIGGPGRWPPAEHPIRVFQQAGLRVTVNTDNPTVSATTLANEHRVLADQFGFSDAEFYRMDRTALEAAFVEDGQRKALLARLETLWAEGQS